MSATSTAAPAELPTRVVVSAGIVLFRRGAGNSIEIFLISEHSGNWGVPKGRLEADETVEQAARRELKEETGFDVEALLPVDPFVSSYTWVRGGKERQEKTVHFFSATPKGEPRAFPNSEVKDGRWTTLDGIDSLTGGKIPADVKTMLVELAGRAEPHLPTTVPDSAPTAPASAGSTGGAAATV